MNVKRSVGAAMLGAGVGAGVLGCNEGLPAAVAQSAGCPAVQVVAVPGTWESSRFDDGRQPAANPRSLMLEVTRPLQARFSPERADVYTVPYVAQFSNPVALPPDGQARYDDSRREGTAATFHFMATRAADCPGTQFVLTGFSQGAVIAGDVAASIGSGQGPIAPDRLLGAALLADGRRVQGQVREVGASPPGVGAEVALQPLNFVLGPLGLTMTGPRDFGAVHDKLVQLCAPADMICATPADAVTNPVPPLHQLARSQNAAHARYHQYEVAPGQTATRWVVDWASAHITGADTP